MGVEKETVELPAFAGGVTIPFVRRGSSGAWSVDLDIDLCIQVDDGRDILVRKRVTVKATEQRGRRRSNPLNPDA